MVGISQQGGRGSRTVGGDDAGVVVLGDGGSDEAEAVGGHGVYEGFPQRSGTHSILTMYHLRRLAAPDGGSRGGEHSPNSGKTR